MKSTIHKRVLGVGAGFVLACGLMFAPAGAAQAAAKALKHRTPGKVKTVKAKVNTAGKLIVRVSKTKHAKGYQYRWKTSSGKKWKSKKSTKRSFKVSVGKKSGTVRVKVRAYQGKKYGPWSKTAKVKASVQKPHKRVTEKPARVDGISEPPSKADDDPASTPDIDTPDTGVPDADVPSEEQTDDNPATSDEGQTDEGTEEETQTPGTSEGSDDESTEQGEQGNPAEQPSSSTGDESSDQAGEEKPGANTPDTPISREKPVPKYEYTVHMLWQPSVPSPGTKLYIESNNPKPYFKIRARAVRTGDVGAVSEGMGIKYYPDVKGIIDKSGTYAYTAQKVTGGYLADLHMPKDCQPGDTIEITVSEYGDPDETGWQPKGDWDYANAPDTTTEKVLGTTVVGDYDRDYDTWMQSVIDRVCNPSDSAKEKVKAVCRWMNDTFYYDGNSRDWHSAGIMMPWVNMANGERCAANSGSGPHIIKDFGTKLGLNLLYYNDWVEPFLEQHPEEREYTDILYMNMHADLASEDLSYFIGPCCPTDKEYQKQVASFDPTTWNHYVELD